MYDVSTMFRTFYKDHVVLSKAERNKLFDKKELNIHRLKEGLKEYNEEKGTNYKLAESMVQGSVSMSTVIKNDGNEYDIDVAIIFEKDQIPEGTTSVKNFVVNALNRKCTGFKVPPYSKTNCVRIEYVDGYHLDFSIYRRYKDINENYKYEHCGSEWRKRDPKAITAWFNQQNKDKYYQLREVVRLLKMFSRSRDQWEMPGGLVLTVLADENYKEYDRIDERFYYTLRHIRDRLYWNKDVYNPADPLQTLKLIKKDNVKINNLFNRLNTYLDRLDVLFEPGCSEPEAIKAWQEFFNHDFWDQEVARESTSKSFALPSKNIEDNLDYRETEEFIEYLFPIEIKYGVRLDCKVDQNGWRVAYLSDILRKGDKLRTKKKLDFYAETDTPKPYEVYWKVKNKGVIAKKRNEVRGQIIKGALEHTENTKFRGGHFVEVYIVKNNTCVARNRIDVPITDM